MRFFQYLSVAYNVFFHNKVLWDVAFLPLPMSGPAIATSGKFVPTHYRNLPPILPGTNSRFTHGSSTFLNAPSPFPQRHHLIFKKLGQVWISSIVFSPIYSWLLLHCFIVMTASFFYPNWRIGFFPLLFSGDNTILHSLINFNHQLS